MAKDRRKILMGRVTSDKMDKTIVVQTESLRRHPLYGKVTRYNRKYKVHDEHNAAKAGDTVRIIESMPMSKHKRWALVEVVKATTEVA